jgi:hypothetical protein
MWWCDKDIPRDIHAPIRVNCGFPIDLRKVRTLVNRIDRKSGDCNENNPAVLRLGLTKARLLFSGAARLMHDGSVHVSQVSRGFAVWD